MDETLPSALFQQPIAFSCPVCESVYSSENILMRHVELIHGCRGNNSISAGVSAGGIKLLKYCPFCDQSFKEQHQFYTHVRQCRAASAPPASGLLLSRTELITDSTTSFSSPSGGGCDDDDDSVDTTETRVCVCIVCGEQLLGDESVLVHMEDQHGFVPVVDEDPECYLCKTTFIDEGELRRHLAENHFGQFYTTFTWIQMQCRSVGSPWVYINEITHPFSLDYLTDEIL